MLQFDDSVEAVRRNAHQALARETATEAGSRAVLAAHLVAVFVRKLQSETDALKAVILEELHHVFKWDTATALAIDAVPACTGTHVTETVVTSKLNIGT